MFQGLLAHVLVALVLPAAMAEECRYTCQVEHLTHMAFDDERLIFDKSDCFQYSWREGEVRVQQLQFLRESEKIPFENKVSS